MDIRQLKDIYDISQAKVACNGDLSKIKSCVKPGFVNSTDNTEQPKIINGVRSDASIFGDADAY